MSNSVIRVSEGEEKGWDKEVKPENPKFGKRHTPTDSRSWSDSQ